MVRGLDILIWSVFEVDSAIVGTEMIDLAVIDHAQRMAYVKGYSTNRIAYHDEPPCLFVVTEISCPEYTGECPASERITSNLR